MIESNRYQSMKRTSSTDRDVTIDESLIFNVSALSEIGIDVVEEVNDEEE